MAGEDWAGRRWFATVLLGASVLAFSGAGAADEARAAGAVATNPRGGYIERNLLLSVPDKLKVGRRDSVAVEGRAEAGDEVSVFVDPKGETCADSASTQPTRAIPLISAVVGEGPFRFEQTYRPRRKGLRSFCAYLRPPSGLGEFQASEAPLVKAKHLRGSVARRTVATALRRHGFAPRVVKSVDPDCHRRRRDLFACRFETSFPGYRLEGGGQVRLGIELSYRFRLKAQGVRFTLTDENEVRRSL